MTTLSKTDEAALRLAIEAARNEDPRRRAQIDDKLSSGESFESVGKFASSCAQSRSLDLKPWEICPADFHASDLNDPRPQRGARKTYDLLTRMLAAGLSRFDPDPIQSLVTISEKIRRSGSS
jgi:hypothetical protein